MQLSDIRAECRKRGASAGTGAADGWQSEEEERKAVWTRTSACAVQGQEKMERRRQVGKSAKDDSTFVKTSSWKTRRQYSA
ncbi:hypothetical protein NDU88_004856 [Pleurodeles waltl]|uniref:Uncharacterized protein n=1 Tax=Pleurodeles waltl TaxID=8319 RepID=A0AAV7UHJ9_PLEWA|nr:hypothetical protein NDU88_004856 [Pleurodeles waltl]